MLVVTASAMEEVRAGRRDTRSGRRNHFDQSPPKKIVLDALNFDPDDFAGQDERS
jgi:hypothetical protein